MAWLFEGTRCCPSCGYKDRILVVEQRADRYRLSCGWCASVSKLLTAREAFFYAWGAPRCYTGDSLDLEGVPVWYKGRYIASVPIHVILSPQTVFIAEKKDAA
jgi:hypothetical protein